MRAAFKMFAFKLGLRSNMINNNKIIPLDNTSKQVQQKCKSGCYCSDATVMDYRVWDVYLGSDVYPLCGQASALKIMFEVFKIPKMKAVRKQIVASVWFIGFTIRIGLHSLQRPATNRLFMLPYRAYSVHLWDYK